MDTLTLIATLLEVLAAEAPAIAGGTSPIGKVLDTVLSTAAALVKAGDAGASALHALTVQIQTMVASGTDPTEAQWTALKERSDFAHALIQGSGTPGTTPTPTSPPSSGSST